MHIPEVKIVYSWIYDQQWEIVWKYYKDHGFEGRLFPEEYPESTVIKEYIEEVKPIWKEVEKSVMETMSQVTGIDWTLDEIKGYVVGYHSPFSDPLTLPICRDREVFIDNLVHEMIHQLLSQRSISSKLSPYWQMLRERYPDVDGKVISHIPVHAIYEAVYREIFDQSRLEKDIKRSQHLESYKKSWEIVQEQGYHSIIDQLKVLRVNTTT